MLTLVFLVLSWQGAAQIKAVPLNEECINDYKTMIRSKSVCLRLITDQSIKTPNQLVIYLHGDNGTGGSSYMSQVASHFTKADRVNIAIIRPGYFDNEGHFSGGNSLGVSSFQVAGRLDNYTKENISIIGHAIENLKQHYQPKRLLLVGHSGGAAIAALLLNEFPGVADGALLINCPTDIKRWRPDWHNSLSPIEHIDHIPHKTVVQLITGADDDVVWPELAKKYTEVLAKKGVHATFYLGLGMGHNFSNEQTRAIAIKAIDAFLNP